MKVKLIAKTENPIEVISRAAGTSYGKDDSKAERVWNCFKAGHMGVFEHAVLTVKIEGISRACSHQLVRHRLASFVQESQRYCRIDTTSDWYVVPPYFKDGEDREHAYHMDMFHIACEYNIALENGCKPEDARFLLPEATKTNITMTVNVRELFHFLDMRTDKAAQWEIRELAWKLVDELESLYNWEWVELMKMWRSKENG